jgi:UDP:flavonoid glycosyltransferase YjiC (YdhE family)
MINGLGLGNSTRCDAVSQHLHARGVEMHMLTSGNGLTYFRNNPAIASLHEMPAFFYPQSQGRISGWRTVTAVPQFARIALAKRRQLQQVLAQVQPHVVVIDSEYTVGPIRRRGIPVVGINNSEVVVSEYLRSNREANSVRSHFWLVEFMDYQFHRRFCDVVLTPSPRTGPSRHPRFKRTGMIVRDAVRKVAAGRDERAAFPLPRDVKSCVFMLSGSNLASVIDFQHFDLPYTVDVVGRDGQSTDKVKFHGRLTNNIELLAKADVLVINGGFSAIGEALCLNKPTFVIPVPGHAEQYVNAHLLNELGHGFVVNEQSILPTLREMYARNEWVGLPAKQPTAGYNGAAECAQIILDRLGQAGASA